MTATNPLLCLEFSASDRAEVRHDAPSYAPWLGPRKFVYETHLNGGAGWPRIAWYILRTILLRRPDLVVTTEYRRAFLVNLALLLTFSRATHVVLSMNLSGKPITTRNRLGQRLVDRVFRRSDAIVVHSLSEAESFAQLHGLPANRFAFSHWGFDLPAESTRFDAEPKPYFCMIGRNNRDFETFAKALHLVGARGIAILPGYMPLAPEVEQSMQVLRDLPMADCVNCIRNAAANVTLLRDDSRGAGHITVVTAMHLGVPQIYSETVVLREYFCAPGFGQAVPLGDVDRVAAAMRDVLATSGQPQAEALAAARKAFAQRWLSNDRSASRMASVILAALEGRKFDLVDPEWQGWLDSQQTSPRTL
jgi:glycosyltransferase involved in cell wall biosynthesis